MLRLPFLALILLALTWVVHALVRDQRQRRREELVARLRSAFLHGAPLAPDVRVASLQEIECAGLRLSLPASWRGERGEAATPRFPIDPAAAAPMGPNIRMIQSQRPASPRRTASMAIHSVKPANRT
jgi:hypothetical protein